MRKLHAISTFFLNNKILLLIIICSLIVKFAIFGYAAINVPGAKFMPDTAGYIEPGLNLIEKGVLATFDESGAIRYEITRTPGYPLFIGALHKTLKLSLDHIIIVQILLVTFAGYVIYKAAYELDKNIALLAAFIFLFDQPVTISTFMLLTEALYTVFIAFFMFFFLKYLKEYRIGTLLLAALMLVIATYIRPISYYLGACLAAGIIYALWRTNIKKAIAHALILLLIFHGALGMWQYRNYVRIGNADFTNIDEHDLTGLGLLHKYERHGVHQRPQKTPLKYYTDMAAMSTYQFFGLPGTLKYLKSKPIKALSKILGYPWVVFWLIGIFFAAYHRLPYRFLLLMMLYFAFTSIIGVGLCVGSRFRVPAMPLISILSASGWLRILNKLKK